MSFSIMKRFNSIVIIICIVFVASIDMSFAEESLIGTVKTLKGAVSIIRKDKTLAADIGFKLIQNDTIRTESNSSVGVILNDKTVLSLGPNSELIINEFVFAPKQGKFSIVLKMLKGTAAYVSGLIAKLSPESVRVETPTASIGIRGTKFVVKVGNQKSSFDSYYERGGPDDPNS